MSSSLGKSPSSDCFTTGTSGPIASQVTQGQRCWRAVALKKQIIGLGSESQGETGSLLAFP